MQSEAAERGSHGPEALPRQGAEAGRELIGEASQQSLVVQASRDEIFENDLCWVSEISSVRGLGSPVVFHGILIVEVVDTLLQDADRLSHLIHGREGCGRSEHGGEARKEKL